MDNISLWQDTAENVAEFPSLKESTQTDVVIVGAGITGLVAAYSLTAKGKKVIVLDAHTVGSGTTGYSTGNLYLEVQPYYQNVITKFDIKTAKAVLDARRFAIDYLEKIVKETDIACKFSRRPWYLYADDKSQKKFFKEVEAFKKLEAEIEEINDLVYPLPFKKAAKIDNQARFHPYIFCLRLAEVLNQRGCEIYEASRVQDIQEKPDHCIVTTETATIKANNVIIATHTPIGINTVQMFTAPYRSYVVAATLKNNYYPEGNWWNLGSPHYAISTHPWHKTHPELLVIAGRHNKTGQDKDAEKHFVELKTFLKDHFEVSDFAYQWSAQHYQTADTIPYIGLAHRSAKRVYMATGYFADGLTYGTLAGMLLCETIVGKNNIWQETFNAQRSKFLASAPFLIKENLNVFMQYLTDFPLPPHKQFSDIKKGEGKVVNIDREKCAVSRDENGALHVVSAVCTHMKCIVSWNNAEQTWDCPCHGSRFTCDGSVIEGPAIQPLEKKSVKDE